MRDHFHILGFYSAFPEEIRRSNLDGTEMEDMIVGQGEIGNLTIDHKGTNWELGHTRVLAGHDILLLSLDVKENCYEG